MNLTFKNHVYQILVEGQLVVVINDYKSACQFAEDHYKHTGAIIIPIPVFTYS